jgi:hypothetical protein
LGEKVKAEQFFSLKKKAAPSQIQTTSSPALDDVKKANLTG